MNSKKDVNGKELNLMSENSGYYVNSKGLFYFKPNPRIDLLVQKAKRTDEALKMRIKCKKCHKMNGPAAKHCLYCGERFNGNLINNARRTSTRR